MYRISPTIRSNLIYFYHKPLCLLLLFSLSFHQKFGEKGSLWLLSRILFLSSPKVSFTRPLLGPRLYLLATARHYTGFELYIVAPFYIPPTTGYASSIQSNMYLFPNLAVTLEPGYCLAFFSLLYFQEALPLGVKNSYPNQPWAVFSSA